MALKDKLVNLEDLKVVHDEVTDLKGANSNTDYQLRDLQDVRIKSIDGKITNLPFEFGKCGVGSSGITYSSDASNRYIRTVEGYTFPLGLGDKIILTSLTGIHVRAYCFTSNERQVTVTDSGFVQQTDGTYAYTLTDSRDPGNYVVMLYYDPLATFTDTTLSRRLSVQHENSELSEIVANASDDNYHIGTLDEQLSENWLNVVQRAVISNGTIVSNRNSACTDHIPVITDKIIEVRVPTDTNFATMQLGFYKYNSSKEVIGEYTSVTPNGGQVVYVDGTLCEAAYIAINFMGYNGSSSSAKPAYYEKLRKSVFYSDRVKPIDGLVTSIAGKKNCNLVSQSDFTIYQNSWQLQSNYIRTKMIDVEGLASISHSATCKLRGSFYTSALAYVSDITINDAGTSVTDSIPATAKYVIFTCDSTYTYDAVVTGHISIVDTVNAPIETDTTLTDPGVPADASAAGTAIGTVDEKVGTPQENFVYLPRTWKSTKGYYYKTGHSSQYTWRDSGSRQTTEKISIDDSVTTLYVFTGIDADDASRVQFWNNNNEIIGDFDSGASGQTTPVLKSCTVPSGTKYVSYTSYGNIAGETYISAGKSVVDAFTEISSIKQAALKGETLRVAMLETGAFYRDGTILSTTSYQLSDYVPCQAGDKFTIRTYGTTDSVFSKAYYDEDKSVLCFDHFGNGATSGVYQEETFTVDSTSAAYVRFTCYGGVLECIKYSLNAEEEKSVITFNKQALDDARGAGINKGRFTNNNNPDSLMLLHFSDIHGTGYNLADISAVQQYLSDVLDDTLCTGDIMQSNWSNSFDFWDANSDGSILTCIGNHDVKASNAGGDGYLTNQQTEADLYGRYMEDYISGWNVVHSDTNLYYYKDYAAKKIRLIVLNLLYPTAEKVAEQNTWLANTLAGAKTAGYGVVIGEHYYPVSGTKISCTFSAEVNFPTSMSNPGNYMYNGDALTTYQATVQTFIDGGGNFVCWLCGHKHADYIVYHPSYPKQVFIGVGGALFTDRANELNHTSDMRRVRGTRSQDCMNVLSIDPADKKIKVIRIGCDRDFLSRHRGVLVLDYSTNPATVVYND